MGLFDSVWVNCPKCDHRVEFQSKAMPDPYCNSFTLADAPTEILTDIMNSPEFCQSCGEWFALIDPRFPPGPPPRPTLVARTTRTPENAWTHEQGMKWWPEEEPFTYADLKEPI